MQCRFGRRTSRSSIVLTVHCNNGSRPNCAWTQCVARNISVEFFLRPTATQKGPAMSRLVSRKNILSMAGTCSVSWWTRTRRFALIPLVAFSIVGLVDPSEAEPSLSGSWSGGGWIAFASGTREKARCRARYSKASSNSYRMRATCATVSGKASQTATVYRLSRGRYRGSFYNTEYNVSGTIRVVVRGRSQSVSLAGDGASASFSMRKR
jgi:hypothetical protein